MASNKRSINFFFFEDSHYYGHKPYIGGLKFIYTSQITVQVLKFCLFFFLKFIYTMTLRFIGNKFIFALKLYNITLWSLLFKILLISSITLKNNFFLKYFTSNSVDKFRGGGSRLHLKLL